MKNVFVFLICAGTGTAAAQPVPFNGYELMDHLVSAIHPNGCTDSYVTGWPNDSIWVNMDYNTLMIGYFGGEWTDQPGDELLLETGYHTDNYEVILLYKSGLFSGTVAVSQQDWTEVAEVDWRYIMINCNQNVEVSPRFILALDFALFGATSNDTVIGIQIFFLPTPGYPDLAGAYIMLPSCPELDLGPDITICPNETATIDATIPFATYLWHDGYTFPIYSNAEPGIYWVDVNTIACSMSDTIHIVDIDEPPLLGNDTLLCAGDSFVLDVTTPGAAYEWQDQSTQPTFTVMQPGAYAVTVTIQNCEISDNIQIDFMDQSDFDLGNDTLLCEGQSLSLDAFIPDATYQWQDNSTNSSYSVTEPGLYQVTVTLAECTAEDEVQIDFSYPEQVDLGPDLVLCEGETVDLVASIEDATYIWQDFSTDSSITVNAPGIYSVTITVDGCTTSDEIQISYNDPEQVDLGPDLDLCEGETVNLDAYMEDATYMWQDFSIGSSITVYAPGNYSVTITVDGCTTSDEVQISYTYPEQVDLGPDLYLCEGGTTTLVAFIEDAIYLWQDSSTLSSFLVHEPGIYSVTITVDECSTSDEVSVNYFQTTSIDLGPDTVLCSGSSVLLDATIPGATYLWQDQSANATYHVSSPGQYFVLVDVAGCPGSDTIDISFLNAIDFTLGPDTTLCSDETLVLYPGIPGAMYQWQDQSTADSLLVSQSGLYYVQASLSSCIAADTIQATYLMVMAPDLGNDTILCEGTTLLLNASVANASLEWQDHSTGPTWLVQVPGVYWVTAMMNGCSVTDTIQVEYISVTSVDLGADTILCEGETYFLDASLTGATYFWQDHTSDPMFLVTQPGSYWVQVSTGNCHASDTVHVEYQMIPSLNLGNDTMVCEGQNIILDVTTTGAQYLWQDGSSSPVLSVSQPGTYWVQVDSGICEAGDTIYIAYHPIPFVDLGSDTTLCQGEILLLQAGSSGITYEWQDHSKLPSFTVDQPGLYAVTVGDGLCIASDTIYVAYLDVGSIHLGSDTVLCAGHELILDPNAPGAQYLWQDNTTFSIFNVTQPGLYWVQVYLAACVAADTIQVDYYMPLVIDLGMDTTLCPGENMMLTAETSGATYIWQDLSWQSSYVVYQGGRYWVEVDVMGCQTSDTIDIFYQELPTMILGNDTTLCDGEMLLLQLEIPGAQYTWQDHSTSPTFPVSRPGIYTVEVLLDPCVTGDTIMVDFIPAVSPDLGADKILCEGEEVILASNLPAGAQYIWQDQSTAETYTVSTTGTYWLQVSDDCGVRADTVLIGFESCDHSIYIPNIFSPNGDGVNDLLVPLFDAAVTDYAFRIYDRFGGLLFETFTWSEGWDGEVQGTMAQTGVYTYVLEFAYEHETRERLVGDITVIR